MYMNTIGWGIPDLQNKYFEFYQCPDRLPFSSLTGLSNRYRNIIIFKNEWNKVNKSLPTTEMLNICDRVMKWFGLFSISFYANRSRVSELNWYNKKISVETQLDGWADVYSIRR